MTKHFQIPKPGASAFYCPHCRTYAQQGTHTIVAPAPGATFEMKYLTTCHQCKDHALWVGDTLVWPEQSSVWPPVNDLPEDVKADYLEASSVLARSPRSAAALLRLGLQKLCNHLGKPGKNINEDIGALVADGLPKKIQQSLDILRITGNCAVHPGELVVDDNLELATKLFQLINLVAFHLITAPKQIDALYEAMPQGARDAVEKRDTKKPK